MDSGFSSNLFGVVLNESPGSLEARPREGAATEKRTEGAEVWRPLESAPGRVPRLLPGHSEAVGMDGSS